MASYGLSEMLLHSSGAHVTLDNKHHGSLHVMLGEWYKNAHNFIKKKKKCMEQFYVAWLDSECHHLPH